MKLSHILSFVADTLWEVWGEPFATAIGAYEPQDRSYGRWKVPFSPMEKRLYENKDIQITFHKTMMPNGKDWVWYQVWQDPEAQRTTGRHADMIFVHGTGVHSGTLASQCRRYLDAGFRLIVPDLPSHGYSSGLHVYQRSISGYCEGLRVVLHDIARRDDAQIAPDFRLTKGERRRTFMLGLSFGGLVAFSYALQYPGSYRYDTEHPDEVPIDGLVGVGPMIGYSKEIRFNPIVHIFGWIMDRVLGGGRLELAVPHKKIVDKDPAVYESLITMDKRSHQGAFRIGHLYCIDEAIRKILKNAAAIRNPIYVQIGAQDRVADGEACLKWLKDTSSEDKRYEVYPICQHVVYRKAKTQRDDLAGRITVIEDNVKWMCQRAPSALVRSRRTMSFSSDLSSLSNGSRLSLFEHESFTFRDDDDSYEDDASVATSAPSTPTTPVSPASLFFGHGAGDDSSMNGDARELTSFAKAVTDAHLLRQRVAYSEVVQRDQVDGWTTGDRDELRLSRPVWDYDEELRPFQIHPYWRN